MQSWTQEQALAAIREVVFSTFQIDISDKPEAFPIADLGLDSMAVLDVVMTLEDQAGKKFDNIALPKNPTLGDVARMVVENLRP